MIKTACHPYPGFGADASSRYNTEVEWVIVDTDDLSRPNIHQFLGEWLSVEILASENLTRLRPICNEGI